MRFRKWLQVKTYWDGCLTLADLIRAGFKRLLQPAMFNRSPRRRLRSFLPQLEGFEDRILPTTVNVASLLQTVQFYAASAVIEVDSTDSATCTVHYSTSGDGAGTDYTSTCGSLSFGPGNTSQDITVPLLDNPEGGGFTLTLSCPVGCDIGDGTSSITIEGGPTPTFANASQSVEYNGGELDLPVLSTSFPYTVTCDYEVDNGSAVNGTNFNADSTGTVSFNPSDTTASQYPFGRLRRHWNQETVSFTAATY